MEETGHRKRYNLSLLRATGIQEHYRVKLTNRFEALQNILEDENNINSQ